MKKRRILVLTHEDLVPPANLDGYSDEDIDRFKTDYDVVKGLEDLDHDVRCLGVVSDLGIIRRTIDDFRPHICFNLLEEFHGVALYDQHVVSFLELMRMPYTGCNPRGLTLGHDKALTKKILAYHRIPAPKFVALPLGKKVRRPDKLAFPLIVKSLSEDASLGISQASVVHSDEKFIERVAFMHEQIGTDAIAEQYIAGRELYVGVLGNQRVQTLPVWEMLFRKLPEGTAPIATAKVKWDQKYQRKIGIKTGCAKGLSPALEKYIQQLARRVYHSLGLSGYARIDMRLTDDGKVYLLEANPNPDLAYGDELADSAEHAGISYGQLLQKIVNLGLRYRAAWRQ